jgi:hypothetical protein
MKRFLFFGLVIMFLSSCKEQGFFSPGEIWLDDKGVHINAHGGGILFNDGKYYWFGEHKTEGEKGNVANVGVHCYSSKNLYDWKDEGIALNVEPENSGSDIEKGCILERPKVIFNAKTGKYVMWFHLELKGNGYRSARSGVAVSEKVTGPYTFVGSMRANAGHLPVNAPENSVEIPSDSLPKSFSGGSLPASSDVLNLVRRDLEIGQMSRDMTLFVDYDGKAYHIHASEENSSLHISELSDDYLSFSGKYGRYFVDRFMEAPAMFKKDGKYYLMMSGCSGWAPNEARSAVANSIWGPWEELGNPCVGDDAELTFHSQSTYILPVQGKTNTFIYIGDRWRPSDAIDGRYIWLPIVFRDAGFIIEWKDKWTN